MQGTCCRRFWRGPASLRRAGYTAAEEKQLSFPLLTPFCIVGAGQTGIKMDRETQVSVAGRERLKYSVQTSLFDPNHLEAKTGRK